MTREGGSIRVLHVDDEPELCELAALHLERANDDIEVVTETSAREGLARIEDEPIDCVVSDHDMPEMDGLEFLKAVRDCDGELPFILYTGKGSEEIASEAISAGVTDYLQKGATSDQYDLLANRIERGVSEVRAQHALAESERMFSTLVANLPGMVYRCRNERGWPMEFVSEGAKELTGYAASAIENGKVDWEGDLIVADDRDSVREQVQRALDAGEPFEMTYRIRTADGDRRWVWERGRPVERTAAETTTIEGFITDVTARRTRERELDAGREFTRSVVDALEDVFVVVEPDGSLVRWNDCVSTVTGYTDEEIARKSATDFFDDATVDRIVAARDEALAEGATTFEADLVAASGERHRYEFRLAAVTIGEDEAGDAQRRLCAIGRDVDPVRQRQQELERYETVIQAVGDPVYTLDADGRFTFANEALGSLTGYEPAELVGEHIEHVVDDGDVEIGRERIRELLREDQRRYAIFEMDVLTREGERVPCENHIALLPMADGDFRGTAGVIRDVSARKERERRLEEFASVVSHDLRNPLEVLAGRVELAKETGDVSHLEEVDRPLDRMHQLIEDLLRLAHRGEAVDETRSVDLATTARDAWHSIDTGDATLSIAGSRTVEADPERFQALLENLVRNALEHGPEVEQAVDGGTDDGVNSATGDGVDGGIDGTGGESRGPPADGNRATTDDSIAVTVGVTPAGFFVEDDGVGVPEADRDSIFDRGFTTQADGTGYGLAIVADVVDAHGWTVAVTEGADGGARFEFEVSRGHR